MSARSLSHLGLSDNGFLFDTQSGYTYTLNTVGTEILKGLISGESREDIIDTLMERYDIGFDALARDVELFTSRLRELGLFSESDAE